MSENKNKGSRSILESVVIVVSILLAFAIEALWDEQLENFTEAKELARLDTEFIANRDRIDRSINLQDGVRLATQDFYNLIKDIPTSDEAIALPNNLMQAMLFAPTFEVTTPVLDSLILSGNLIVIEDESVLAQISSWKRSVAQVTEAEVSASEFTATKLFPILAKRGNIGPLLVIENTGQRQNERPGEAGGMGGGEAGGMGGGGMGAMAGMGGTDDNTLSVANDSATQNGNSQLVNSLPPSQRNRFNDDRETLIIVDDELRGIVAQRIREAGRSAATLDTLKTNANRLLTAIKNAQDN